MTPKMKAIQFMGKENMRLTEIPVPEIGEDEALLKVRAASICGSDVRMYRNGYKNVSEENPLIIGHEFAGVIAKVGKNVKGLSVGQRASVAPNIGCGHCDHCVRGDSHLCEELTAFGIDIAGGFAEYVRIPEKAILQGNVVLLQDDISFQEAALVEPLGCVYNGQMLLDIHPGDDVLIIGMGPIGVMHIMMAKLFGAGRIFVNDLVEERVDQAEALFPDVYPIRGDVREGFARYGVRGADVCIIAAPSAAAQAQSLEYMNMNGKILFFGGLPADREVIPVNSNLIHYRQLRIQGCSKQSVAEYRLCAKLVNDGRIPLGLIMSDSYPLERFDEAMANAAAAKGLKHVITFD